MVLPVVRAPRAFELAGVRWGDSEAPRAVELRARRSGRRWSPWTPVPIGAGHGPDGGRRRASDPVWTGRADELELRVRGHRSSLHAAFVAVRDAARPHARVAQAPVGPPGVIHRAAWGGDRVEPRDAPTLGEVQVAFVHHTVNANDYAPEESAGMVLAIARFHRDHNGWDDLGYNFLVDRYGQVFEGRAGGMDQPVVGAQAQGFNHLSTGIACLGTFGTEALPAPAFEALARTIAWKLAAHATAASGPVTVTSRGGSASRYAAGRQVTLDRVSGHRDGGRTECPGDALHGQLPALRARVAKLAATMPHPAVAQPALRARATTRRVRATGRGVLVRGSAPAGQPVTVSVARQDMALRFRFVRRVKARPRPDGDFAVRVRLPRPGVYRLLVQAAGQRVALHVRSVRR